MTRLRRSEARVLWALKTIPPEEAYGLRLANMTGMPFRFSGVLLRLRGRGWIQSTVELLEPGETRPPRVLYRLTPAGRMMAAGVLLEDCAKAAPWGWLTERLRRQGYAKREPVVWDSGVPLDPEGGPDENP